MTMSQTNIADTLVDIAIDNNLIDLDAAFRESNVQALLDELERELVGLKPV